MNTTNVGVARRISGRQRTRRAALRDVGIGLASGFAAATGLGHHRNARGAVATPVATPGSPAALTDAVLGAFEADVEAAIAMFQVPGAAVALVQGNEIAYSRGFGRRDLEHDAPVTPRTRFRTASITKSMTALLLAILVAEGILDWDDLAVDLWPGFRAPSPELTRTLRLRDLLGMASGIAESDTVSVAVVEFFMMAGLLSAGDVLRSVADQPVIAPPDTTFSYNNTLFSAAGYLGLLATGMSPAELEDAYVVQMRDRVFAPTGMADAAILDDPRPLGDDFAVGYTRDIFGEPSPLPFVSPGGIAPAGSGLASVTDMALYLIMQMSGGVASDGTRVVSAANLAEMHRPGILIEPGQLYPPELRPDTVAMHYGLGWFNETFGDGRRLIWHAGGIDGFDSLTGFFPEEQLGFVFLTNLDRGGGIFNLSVQASLLGRLFGLTPDVPALLASFAPMLESQTAQLAAQTRPVDPTIVGPYLGLYEDGFRVRLDEAGGLRLEHDIRSMPMLALPDGSYVVAGGPEILLEQRVTFMEGADGAPVMTITGFEPVRWLTGG